MPQSLKEIAQDDFFNDALLEGLGVPFLHDARLFFHIAFAMCLPGAWAASEI